MTEKRAVTAICDYPVGHPDIEGTERPVRHEIDPAALHRRTIGTARGARPAGHGQVKKAVTRRENCADGDARDMPAHDGRAVRAVGWGHWPGYESLVSDLAHEAWQAGPKWLNILEDSPFRCSPPCPPSRRMRQRMANNNYKLYYILKKRPGH